MKWDEMTPRKLDALVAEHIMGWLRVRPVPPHNREYIGQPPGSQNVNWVVYSYSTDHAAVALVRAEIARQELSRRFIIELFAIIGLDGETTVPNDYVWALINASPEQQCLAALRAKGVEV